MAKSPRAMDTVTAVASSTATDSLPCHSAESPLCCGRMTVSQADVLEFYLRAQNGVQAVKVYDRTQDAVVLYEAERGNIIRALATFSFAKAEAMELVPEHTSRALNREFEDKLAVAVMRRCISAQIEFQHIRLGYCHPPAAQVYPQPSGRFM